MDDSAGNIMRLDNTIEKKTSYTQAISASKKSQWNMKHLQNVYYRLA